MAAADSVFEATGINIDSVYLKSPDVLVLAVTPGALKRPMRLDGRSCTGGQESWRATQQVGQLFYKAHGKIDGLTALEIHTQAIPVERSGWGWSEKCSSASTGGSVLNVQQMDSLRTASAS